MSKKVNFTRNYVVHVPATGKLLLVTVDFKHTIEDVQRSISERPHLGAFWEARSFMGLLRNEQTVYFTDLQTFGRNRLNQVSHLGMYLNRGVYGCTPVFCEGEPLRPSFTQETIDLGKVEAAELARYQAMWTEEQAELAEIARSERAVLIADAAQRSAEAKRRGLAIAEQERVERMRRLEEDKERRRIERREMVRLEALRVPRHMERRGLDDLHVAGVGVAFNGSDAEFVAGLRDTLQVETYRNSSGCSSYN